MHATPENWEIQVLGKVISSVLKDHCGFFHAFEKTSVFSYLKDGLL